MTKWQIYTDEEQKNIVLRFEKKHQNSLFQGKDISNSESDLRGRDALKCGRRKCVLNRDSETLKRFVSFLYQFQYNVCGSVKPRKLLINVNVCSELWEIHTKLLEPIGTKTFASCFLSS